jgi:hypothetical protein
MPCCCPQAAGDDVALSSLMAATTAATREAAAAVSWAWLRGYELSVAGQQEWPGPGPREGDSDLETHLLVQELLAHGVSEVGGAQAWQQGNRAAGQSNQSVNAEQCVQEG